MRASLGAVFYLVAAAAAAPTVAGHAPTVAGRHDAVAGHAPTVAGRLDAVAGHASPPRRLGDEACPAGEFEDGGGCAPCPADSYSAAGAAECLPCLDGSFTQGNDRAGPGACVADESLLPREWSFVAGRNPGGVPQSVYMNGVGTDAGFTDPSGLAFDSDTGTIYVADHWGIRQVEFGTGTSYFDGASGLSLDSVSGVLLVAEEGKHKIRAVDTNTAAVTTLAGGGGSEWGGAGFDDGTGAAASFYTPRDVAWAASGSAIVADTWNNAIRVVIFDTGLVSTLAGGVVDSCGGFGCTYGNDDGIGTNASFNNPSGVAFDPTFGTVYVADTGNHAIRAIIMAFGAVATLAGGGGNGCSWYSCLSGFGDGIGTHADFAAPTSVAFNPTSGMVIVADVGNDAIRAVAFDTGATTTLGLVSDAESESCVTVTTATGAGVLECVYAHLTSGLAVDPNTGVVFVTGTDYSLRYIGCASGFGAVGTSCSGCSAGTAGGVGGVCSVCPVGRFTAMDFSAGDPFSAQCDLCADLTFAYGTEAADHRACGTCSAGTWPGAESCEPCYNSRYSNNAALQCSTCPEGSFNAGNTAEDHAGPASCIDVGYAGRRAWMTVAGSVAEGTADGAGTMASFRSPMAVEYEPSSRTIVVADTLNSAIRTIFLDDHSVTWLAGDGVIDDSLGEAVGGFVDGTGTMASFSRPEGVTVDSSTGTVFVADTVNNAIRTVALDTGAVGTLAGGSGSGSANGIGTLASFWLPGDVAFDPTSGTVFVADTKNDVIRTVASDTGAVATFAGGGGDGNDCVGCRSSGYGFDDGIGTLASFNYPSGLAFDPSSDTLYVADTMNNAIRTVASDGTVKTLAGSGSYGANNAVGTNASFRHPNSVAYETSSGLVFVAAPTHQGGGEPNNRIRIVAVDTGSVSDFTSNTGSGHADGFGTAVYFSNPNGIAVDSVSGTVFVADRSNNAVRATACQDGFGGSSVYTCSGCGPGTSSRAGQCLACTAGLISTGDFTGAGLCAGCPVGRFLEDDDPAAIELHDSEADCDVCLAGTYAGETGKTECDDCPAGRFLEDDGTQALAHASLLGCTDCAPGQFTGSTGNVACEQCGIGQYQITFGQSACLDCAAGAFSESAAIGCTPCDAGQHASADRSACVSCVAGTFSSTGSSECSACPRGTISGAAAASCTACESGRETSNPAGTGCICSSGHYRGNEGSCEPCLENADCASNDEKLVLLNLYPGYWRMTSWSTNLRTCPILERCAGGNATAEGGNATAEELAFDPELYCAAGYAGILCASCASGYAPQGDGTCALCSSEVTIRVVVIMAAVALLAECLRRLQAHAAARAEAWLESHPRAGAAVRGVKHKVKILLTMSQIVGQFPKLFTIAYPKVYLNFFSPLDLLSIDLTSVLAMGCIYIPSNFHQELVITTLLPLFFAGLLVLYGMAEKARTGLMTNAFSWFLLLTYLVFPSVSTKIFMTFSCDAGFADGDDYADPQPRRFLKADYRIDCDSDEHKAYESYAQLMMLVYPLGIPFMYFVLLYRVKSKVDPTFDEETLEADMAKMAGDAAYAGAHHKMNSLASLVKSRNAAEDDEAGAFESSIGEMKEILAADLRHHDTSIAYLEFLWGAYEPRCWYWEVVESLRRLMLTGMLVFCMPESATQIVIGILIAIFSIFFYGKVGPYTRDQDDALAEYAQYAVFFTLFASLLLFVNVSAEDGYGDAIFGGAMVGVNLIVAFIASGQILADAYQEQWDQIKSEHRGATCGFLLGETIRRIFFPVPSKVAVAPAVVEEGSWTAGAQPVGV